jgi:hypothetical protein
MTTSKPTLAGRAGCDTRQRTFGAIDDRPLLMSGAIRG